MLKKCTFFTETIDCLGQVIHPGKLQSAAPISDAINVFKEPHNVTELRSFLGLCNDFYWFIPSLTCIGDVLNKKLNKSQLRSFEDLNNERKTVLKTLQKWLITHRILAPRCAKGQYIVGTQACNRKFGAASLEEHPDKALKPVGYC